MTREYKDFLVFDDKDLLFKQIHNMLEGTTRASSILKEEDLRKYDTFEDNRALERFRESLYELTGSGGI